VGAAADEKSDVGDVSCPTAPKGHESNWVQTIPGNGWNVFLRLYGPGQSWFDKTWKPGEFVLGLSLSAQNPRCRSGIALLLRARRC
jgi:hypothetical protein